MPASYYGGILAAGLLVYKGILTVAQKWILVLLSITLLNIDHFSKFFQLQIEKYVGNEVIS